MFEKRVEKVNKNMDKNTKEKSCICSSGDNKWIFLFIIGIAIGVLIGYLIGLRIGLEQPIKKMIDQQPGKIEHLTKTEVAEKLKTFISNYLINEEQKIELINIEEISGLYRMNLEIDNNPIKFYMTKDGEFLIDGRGVENFAELKAEMQIREERNREEREWREKSDQFQAALTLERKEKIAKCLTEKGFRVYIADWCPFCRKQKELFGEAAKYLTSIDCFDPDGAERNIAKCPDIQGVPAWKDGEGNMLQGGMLPIKRLVQLSDCDY